MALVKTGSGTKARARRVVAEAMIVGVAGLSAVAVAHASLLAPGLISDRTAQRPATAVAAAAVAAPAEDDVLIAFQEPVPGHAVVSPFGLRQLPWEGSGRLHEGVDIWLGPPCV